MSNVYVLSETRNTGEDLNLKFRPKPAAGGGSAAADAAQELKQTNFIYK